MIGTRRFCDDFFGEVILVVVRLQVGRIGVKNPSVVPLALHGSQHNLVKDLLIDPTLVEAPAAILTEGRGIRNLVCQAEAKKPAVGHIDLDLPDQLAFRAHTKEVAEKEHLKENYRINGRSTIVGAVEVSDLHTDEGEVDHPFDFA